MEAPSIELQTHATLLFDIKDQPTMNRDYLTIVSGLPRSGTSMMMRMIGEGGIPSLTDSLRSADVDNPRGYYEFEPVKTLKQDASWIAGGLGKVVKMVHLLLFDLPLTFQYRVVFMQRNFHEMIRSQNQMLERLQGPVGDLPEQRLIEIYQAQIQKALAYLQSHADCFRFVTVNYNALMQDPEPQVRAVSMLLDGLDVDKMLGTIDPALYRNREAK